MSGFGETKLGGFVIGLLVLCGVMVGVGVLLPGGDATPAGYHPMSSPAKPVRLVIPAIKLRAAIKPIEVNDQQVLDPPEDPSLVGWWKRSARTGATQGQTVLTGHTVHTGGGVMDRLGKLHRGQKVRVVTRQGTMVYRTTRVVTWSKEQLAKRAEDLFLQERADERLVLITCTDWNGSSYDSNIVVFADPLGVRDPGEKSEKSKKD